MSVAVLQQDMAKTISFCQQYLDYTLTHSLTLLYHMHARAQIHTHTQFPVGFNLRSLKPERGRMQTTAFESKWE